MTTNDSRDGVGKITDMYGQLDGVTGHTVPKFISTLSNYASDRGVGGGNKGHGFFLNAPVTLSDVFDEMAGEITRDAIVNRYEVWQ